MRACESDRSRERERERERERNQRERDRSVSLMAARWPCREQQLKLYALFKQASIGACNTERPGMLDFAGKESAMGGCTRDLTD